MTDQRSTRPFDRRAFLRSGAVAAGAVVLGSRLDAADRVARTLRLPVLRPGAGLVDHVSFPAPPIVTRAEWGADESLRKGSPGFAAIGHAVVHHTDTANDESDPRARVRSIYKYHTEYRGWNDIGYNFLIDREGRIYEGRYARGYADGEPHSGEDDDGRGVIGAHAGGYNTGSVGIALLGTFTGSGPSEAAVDSLVQVLAWKLGSRDVDPHGSDVANGRAWPNIAGHRDVTSTGCPGDGMYPRLPEVRDRVRAAMAVGLVGYRILRDDGGITTHGDALDLGDLPRSFGIRSAPVRGIASTASGLGAWVVGPDGGIFSFGDAPFFGSMGGTRLNRPMVGIAPTATGAGYWTVASDGGVFSFGDARFHGSTGSIVLNKPIVGMATTPGGNGYWMVASDGGLFSFGDAGFYGSTGGLPIPADVVGMSPTPSGEGYWLLGADATVYPFGDAPALVGAPARMALPARSIRSTPSGLGYWILDSGGGVYTFGDAPFFGGGIPSGRTALDLAPVVRP